MSKAAQQAADSEIREIGNQQKRSREKAALRSLVAGDIDFIPEFLIDHPSKWMNG
jgi:hypothetical protein